MRRHAFAVCVLAAVGCATTTSDSPARQPQAAATPATAAAALSAATCANLVPVLKENAHVCRNDRAESAGCKEAAASIAIKFFECNQIDAFFENVGELIPTDAPPVRSWLSDAAFDALEPGNKEPLAKLWAYLDGGERRFTPAVSVDVPERRDIPFSGIATFRWMRKHHRDAESCKQADRRTMKLDPRAQYLVIGYMADADCPDVAIASAISTWLPSVNWGARASGCEALGKVGKTADILDRLDRLAQTDPYSAVVEENGYGKRVYPVRDACAEAANQVRSRLP